MMPRRTAPTREWPLGICPTRRARRRPRRTRRAVSCNYAYFCTCQCTCCPCASIKPGYWDLVHAHARSWQRCESRQHAAMLCPFSDTVNSSEASHIASSLWPRLQKLSSRRSFRSLSVSQSLSEFKASIPSFQYQGHECWHFSSQACA